MGTVSILFLPFLLLSGVTGESEHLVQRTAVEEVSGDSGIIDFDGIQFPELKRKVWILQGNENKWSVSLAVVEGSLGQNAHLSVWSIPASPQLTNGSSVIDWSNGITLSGVNIVLVTLSITGNSPVELPNFKLQFNSEMTLSSPPYILLKEVRSSEGPQSISYPPQNYQNYPRSSFFYSLIAPSSGNPFALTLQYLDIPGTPPLCGDKWFAVYVLRDLPVGTIYDSLPAADYRRCGQVGEIAEFLGKSEVALVWFWSNTEEVGKGFRIEVQPLEQQMSTGF